LRSSAAQILETALALHRAPGERFRLRERPLPPGIVHAIEIAAGSPAAVQAAAVELGEPEHALVEAARFYLEQVLFADPDANAYRVLGLAPDATTEAIRAHHRWLQRWLHPDRAQAGDASVFATRVNQGFAQLRTPEARHAYDVRLAEARLAGASARLAPETVRSWGQGDDDGPQYGRRSRWLLAAALLSCAVLAVLIVRNPDRQAAWPSDEDRDDSTVGGTAGMPEKAVVPVPPDLATLGDALLATPASEPAQQRTATQAPPAWTASNAGVGNPPGAPGIPRAAPAATAGPAIARVAPRLPPRSTRGVAEAVSQAALTQAAQVVAATTPAQIAEPPVVPTPTPPAVIPASSEPTRAVRASSVPARTTAAKEMPPLEAEATFVRLQLAQRRADEVVRYLGQRRDAVPLWNAPGAQAEADSALERLNARPGSLEVSQANWRIGTDHASLEAIYRCRHANTAPCQGRVAVELVWREGLWLVRGVRLAPAP
jgi:hypothetical protein